MLIALYWRKKYVDHFRWCFFKSYFGNCSIRKEKNIDCLAIVRGEEYSELNPLLTLAKEYGMNFVLFQEKSTQKEMIIIT